MAQLPRYNQDGIEQLLQMWVTSLGVIEHLANEINRSLDRISSADLWSFDNNGHANHSIGCRDVK
jgi:hypothetical protein